MNGKDIEEDEVLDDDSSDEALTDTVVLSDDLDDIVTGDTTIEMDIENLVAQLEASDSEDVHRRAEIRRKLEDLREQREQELDSTFNFNMDED